MSKRADPFMQYKGQLVVIQLREPYAVSEYARRVTAPHADDPDLQRDVLDNLVTENGAPALTQILTGAWLEGATEDGEMLIVRLTTPKQAVIEILIDPALIMFMTRLLKAPSSLLLSAT